MKCGGSGERSSLNKTISDSNDEYLAQKERGKGIAAIDSTENKLAALATIPGDGADDFAAGIMFSCS